jgi:molybdopterin-containing oxidoreductase family membrane subunit
MAAFVHQLRRGGLAVTGLNDRVFWATYETDLVAFIGLSYGGALVSAILRLSKASWRGPISRIAEASALVTLAVGALFPIIHLGHPELIWELFARPQPNSPLFWDMVAILTYLLATVVLFGLPLIPDLAAAKEHPDVGDRRLRLYRWASAGWRGTARQRTVLDRALTGVSILVIPLAVMVHTVLSYAFSLTSRRGWHSTIFGPYFVVAAVYSGIALMILAAVAYRRAYRLDDWIDERSIRLLGFLMAALGVAYAYFTFTELTTEGYVGEKATEAVLYLLMMKRYTVLFWLFVALGLVAPVLLIALRRTRTVGGITLAAALVVAAMWLKRLLIVVPPLARPLLGEAWGSYAPSWVEVAITLGTAAAVALLMMLLFRVVPVLSVHELREIRRARLPGQPGWQGPPGGSARVAATRLEGGGEP